LRVKGISSASSRRSSAVQNFQVAVGGEMLFLWFLVAVAGREPGRPGTRDFQHILGVALGEFEHPIGECGASSLALVHCGALQEGFEGGQNADGVVDWFGQHADDQPGEQNIPVGGQRPNQAEGQGL
jgi:hypothetical protein